MGKDKSDSGNHKEKKSEVKSERIVKRVKKTARWAGNAVAADTFIGILENPSGENNKSDLESPGNDPLQNISAEIKWIEYSIESESEAQITVNVVNTGDTKYDFTVEYSICVNSNWKNFHEDSRTIVLNPDSSSIISFRPNLQSQPENVSEISATIWDDYSLQDRTTRLDEQSNIVW